MHFEVVAPDFRLSPHTDDPEALHRMRRLCAWASIPPCPFLDTPDHTAKSARKTYPQPDDPPCATGPLNLKALERTLSLAGPVIHVQPDIKIHDIPLKTIIAHHLYNALTPGHPNSIPLPEDLPDAQLISSPASSADCAQLLF